MQQQVIEFHPTFLSRYDNIIFDMDGVLIHGTEFLHGIVDMLDQLRDKYNKKILFCTNNSTLHRSAFFPYFEQQQFTIPINNLYTAAYSAASTVFNDIFFNTMPTRTCKDKVLVIGENGLKQEFYDLGLKDHIVTLSDLHNNKTTNILTIKEYEVDPTIKGVCIGLQTDFSWIDCAIVVMIVRENNAKLYATDRDATYPTSKTRLLPGCGSIVNMIEGSAGKKAQTTGKPTTYMINTIQRDHQLDLSRTLMVGDRLDSDIAFGNLFHIDTMLVFTGVTRKDEFILDKTIIPLDQALLSTPTPNIPSDNSNSNQITTFCPTYCADNATWLLQPGGTTINH